MFAWTDAQYGYWASPSNKPMVGITGTGRVDEYLENDENCRANLLNRAAITTIIRNPAGGFTPWGNRTLSADPKWSFVHRVRILYILMDAIQVGLRWAVDRSMSKTFVQDVSKSLEFFMADRRAEGAVIDFDVYPDPELNTESSLSEGRLYLNVRFGDTPIAENPIIRFEVTNDYITQLLD
jgi:phage tail sheath protein FI